MPIVVLATLPIAPCLAFIGDSASNGLQEVHATPNKKVYKFLRSIQLSFEQMLYVFTAGNPTLSGSKVTKMLELKG